MHPVRARLERRIDIDATGIPARATGLRRDFEAQAEQVRSVEVQRPVPRIGSVPPALMEKLDHTLRLRLSL
jgi:mRNA-degrading endonuclease toxin of MazEF toxin-antitoxin module